MNLPAWIASGAAVASGGAAWTAAINGSRTLARARRDSRERSRPMLAAELQGHTYSRGTQSLVVRNYGTTIARNVHVRFDPPIPDPAPEFVHGSVTPYLKKRYAGTIALITPGMELKNLWFVGEAVNGKFVNSEPTPNKFTVSISYESSLGDRYQDDFLLDVDLLSMQTSVTSSSEPANQIKEAAKNLKEINRSLSSIARPFIKFVANRED
jgi:hypothetical protein